MPEDTINEEEVLIKRAQNGDEAAFSALYQEHITSLYRFVYAKVGSREDVEDLVQITFIKILKALPDFNFESSFRRWAYQIALNVVMDYWRQRYKAKELPLENFLWFLKNEERSVDVADVAQKEKKIEEVLKKLNKNQQDVLRLRFLKGYTIKETASELAISKNNIKVLQHRALKKAAELMSI